MKKYYILLLLSVLIASCSDSKRPKCYNYKTVLNVSPHHATRIFVTYISTCGDTIVSTEHCSGTIKAENITFCVGDYLNGKLKYGDVKH